MNSTPSKLYGLFPLKENFSDITKYTLNFNSIHNFKACYCLTWDCLLMNHELAISLKMRKIVNIPLDYYCHVTLEYYCHVTLDYYCHVT